MGMTFVIFPSRPVPSRSFSYVPPFLCFPFLPHSLTLSSPLLSSENHDSCFFFSFMSDYLFSHGSVHFNVLCFLRRFFLSFTFLYFLLLSSLPPSLLHHFLSSPPKMFFLQYVQLQIQLNHSFLSFFLYFQVKHMIFFFLCTATNSVQSINFILFVSFPLFLSIPFFLCDISTKLK